MNVRNTKVELVCWDVFLTKAASTGSPTVLVIPWPHKQQMFISCSVLEAAKYKTKAAADLEFGKGLFPGSCVAPSCCVLQ